MGWLTSTAENSVGRGTALPLAYVCPACRHALHDLDGPLHCERCDVTYPVRQGQPDLRLRSPQLRTVEVPVGEPIVAPLLAPIGASSAPPPGFEWSAPHNVVGNGLTPGLLERVPLATRPDAVLLDVGCGRRSPGSEVANARGYHYVGLDFGGDAADALADAHALPVDSDSVDCVASFSVLEHLADPFEATREVRRVLRPGALYVGTVAFLEPFHLDSYFHMTHLGVAQVMRRGGLELVELETNEDWLASDALDAMEPRWGRLTLMRRTATHRLARAARRVASRVHPKDPDWSRNVTGGFRFVARRPGT